MGQVLQMLPRRKRSLLVLIRLEEDRPAEFGETPTMSVKISTKNEWLISVCDDGLGPYDDDPGWCGDEPFVGA